MRLRRCWRRRLLASLREIAGGARIGSRSRSALLAAVPARASSPPSLGRGGVRASVRRRRRSGDSRGRRCALGGARLARLAVRRLPAATLSALAGRSVATGRALGLGLRLGLRLPLSSGALLGCTLLDALAMGL